MSSTGFITRSNACALSNKPDRTEEERSPSFQPLLESLMNDHYRLYEIENRDKPNVLYRALISLCELGATREQLVAAYCDILPDLAPLQSTVSSNITEDKWREHLGDSSSYSGYLAFFGDQIRANGTDATVHRYFFEGKLYVSIGSHLQPLVHLAFGLEHDLPPLIAQGLAYLASSYSDISDMLYCTNSSITSTENDEEDEKVLFDLVASDPRFNGKMESSLTSSQASKRLLKTHKLLLTTYIKHPQLSLERLTRLAASFLVAEGCKKSLAGVQLLESALAIQTLCSLYGERSDELLQVQYLATLCTYVLLDRPSNAILQTHNNSRDNSSAGAGDWKACTVAILDQGDIPSILALKALLKAHSLYDKNPIYYNVAKALEQSEGRWRRL